MAILSEILVKSGAYRDLDDPIILASGELGIYFINSEKVLGDDGAWEEFGHDHNLMAQHVLAQFESNLEFREVITTMVAEVRTAVSRSEADNVVISGGQRRDWPFSIPVAQYLDLPHVALYKGGQVHLPMKLEWGVKTEAIHVADLLTKGSSAYDNSAYPASGWIPMLRNEGMSVNYMFNLVSRLQRGEARLRAARVEPISFVSINAAFLEAHSTDPERALAYQADPGQWSEDYIRENGISAFIPTFDPQGGKLKRARSFVTLYKEVLEETGAIEELREAVQGEYHMPLGQLVGE